MPPACARMLFIIICLCTTSGAEIYYVSASSGNDDNDGLTPDSAWRTLAKITATALAPGDTIRLRRGDRWRERLHVTSSGSPGLPVTVDAYGGGPPPEINGADPLQDWNAATAPVYTATVAEAIELVAIDGASGDRATSPGEVSEQGDWHWDGATLQFYAETPPAEVTVATRRFTVLFNEVADIVVRNLAVRHGFDPVWLDDSSRITVEHLDIRDSAGYAGVFITADEPGRGLDNVVRHCTVANIHGSTESLGFQNDGVGIYVYGKDFVTGTTIANNTVQDVGHEGIALALTTDNVVRSNVVSGSAQSGIRVALETSARNIIERNEVFGNCHKVDDRFGIDLIRVGNDNVVRYNFVHGQAEVPGGPYKSGGIRFDGGDWEGFDNIASTGNVAYYNVVFDEYVGINVFNASNVAVYNNTVVAPTGFGLALHSVSSTIPTGIIARNNLVYAETEVPIFVNAVEDITLSHNAYLSSDAVYFVWAGAPYDFAGWLGASSQDAGALFSNLDLRNVPDRDFRLEETSPCIDAAIPLGGLTRDFLGNPIPQQGAPDIGAHEFRSTGGQTDTFHAADSDADSQISLSELLRVVQIFRFNGFHCDPDGEDGFAPGAGIRLCTRHDSDYSPADWDIGFSEVLRLVQLYNAGEYSVDPDSEDGFRPL